MALTMPLQAKCKRESESKTMKNPMPRLIDDRRRSWCIIGVIVLAAVVVLSLLSCNAYMRPYRKRHAQIAQEMREYAVFLKTFSEELSVGDGGALAVAQDSLRRALLLGRAHAEPEPLEIDATLYVPEDRQKAVQLAEAWSEAGNAWRRAFLDYASATNRALRVAAEINRLKDAGNRDKAPDDAMSDLGQCQDELGVLYVLARPRAGEITSAFERSHHAYAAALDARSKYSNWVAEGKVRSEEANAAVAAVEAAMAAMTASRDRMESLKRDAGLLRIDREGARISSLIGDCEAGIAALESAEVRLRDAVKAVAGERRGIFDNARLQCEDIAGKALAFDKAHGPLLRADISAKIKAAMEATNALKKAFADDEAVLRRQVGELESKLSRSKALREETARAVARLRGVIESGAPVDDGARIAALPATIGDLCGEILSDAKSLDNRRLRKSVEEIVAGAIGNLSEIEFARPDVPALLKDLRGMVADARGDIVQIRSRLIELRQTLLGGDGVAKTELDLAASNCEKSISDVDAEMRSIETATAADGRQFSMLKVRFDTAMTALGKVSGAVDALNASINAAIKNGRFSKIIWDKGAIGRDPSQSSSKRFEVLTGETLVASGEAHGPSYEWEFALDFDGEKNHSIEIRAAPTENRIYNLNVNMPDNPFKGNDRGNELKPRKGGYVIAEYSLTAADSRNLRWTSVEPYVVPNKYKVKVKKNGGDAVINATAKFPKGRTIFRLRLDLSIDMTGWEDKDKSRVNGVNLSAGWHPEGMSLAVFVDGIQVRDFVHRRP